MVAEAGVVYQQSLPVVLDIDGDMVSVSEVLQVLIFLIFFFFCLGLLPL